MNQRKALLLQLLAVLVVAAGVGAYAYLGVFKKDEHETKKKAHEERLFAPQKFGETLRDGGSPPAEFVKLTVTVGAEVTELERAPGSAEWRITKPLRARADRLVTDSIVSQLQQAKFKTTLVEEPTAEELKTFGLTPPQFVVIALAQVGDDAEPRTVKLEGGIENTFDGTIYMRRNDEKAVYLAEGGVRWSLAKSTFDLRDKDVLGVDETKVTKFALKSKNNDWLVERAPPRLWSFVSPPVGRTDAALIDLMIGSLRREHATTFLDDSPQTRAANGLTPPFLDATFTMEDGKTVHLALSAPPAADAGSKIFALREDELGVQLAEVPATALSDLDRNVNDLRDHGLLTFKREAVTKLVFHPSAGVEFTLEKASPDAGAESWQVRGSRSGPARVARVAAVISALAGLRGAQFVDDAPKEKDLANKYAIDTKARFVALFDAAGTELARVTFGAPTPAAMDSIYVRGTRESVMSIEVSRLKDLPATPDELLDGPDAGSK